MSTNAELAAKLLRVSAEFMRSIGEQNPSLTEQLDNNARTLETVAGLVETDPLGEVRPPDQDEQD